MPRKRRAAREYRRDADVTKRVAAKFDNALRFLMPLETFHTELPTAEERLAFARLFPEQVWYLCGFRQTDMSEYPSCTDYLTNVFRRPSFSEFIKRHGRVSEFEVPDLRAVKYKDRELVLARARAAWWQANNIPMTPKELAWLAADRTDGSLEVVARQFTQQLHEAKGELTAAEGLIQESMFAASKGNNTLSSLSAAMFAQSAAQAKIATILEQLGKARVQLGQATEAVIEAEARLATQQAAELEAEIIGELGVFAQETLAFSRRCAKIDSLKARATKVGGALLSPNVINALLPNWGEQRTGVEDRLALIAKVTTIPEEAALKVWSQAREQAQIAKSEAARGARIEAERKRGGKLNISHSFQQWFEENLQTGQKILITKVVE